MKKNDETKKKAIVDKAWLDYFNEYLFNKGVISEEDRNKIRTKILKRYC